MRFGFGKRGIKMVVVLVAMVFAGAAHAQETTTTQTRSFEIISIDGDVLVVREPSGTRELIVPSDFRFNVDGKSLALSDLKPGMKGTATVTKTTISRPVHVTAVKNVEVVKTLGGSVIVKDDAGTFKMYSQSEIDQRAIHVFMDGKPVKLDDLREGDRLTASLVTEGPPQTMSKTEVDVTLAKAAAAPKAKTAAPATTSGGSAPEVSADTTSAEPAPVAETPAVDTTAAPAAPASRSSSLIWLGLIIVILVVLLVMRRRSKGGSRTT